MGARVGSRALSPPMDSIAAETTFGGMQRAYRCRHRNCRRSHLAGIAIRGAGERALALQELGNGCQFGLRWKQSTKAIDGSRYGRSVAVPSHDRDLVPKSSERLEHSLYRN